jgi:hypothetical protein
MSIRVWVAALGVVGIVASVIVVIMAYVAGLRTRMAVLRGTCLACMIGSAVGLSAVYIAMQHNPQGVYVSHETGAVNYADLSALFLSGFAVVSIAAGGVLALVVRALRGLRALRQLLKPRATG